MDLKYSLLAGLLVALCIGCDSDSEESCAEIEQQALDFEEVHQTCSKDSDCKAGPEFDCFGGCGTVINQSTDAKQFQTEGERLASKYKGNGCVCGQPACADNTGLELACVQGSCAYRPSADASTAN